MARIAENMNRRCTVVPITDAHEEPTWPAGIRAHIHLLEHCSRNTRKCGSLPRAESVGERVLRESLECEMANFALVGQQSFRFGVRAQNLFSAQRFDDSRAHGLVEFQTDSVALHYGRSSRQQQARTNHHGSPVLSDAAADWRPSRGDPCQAPGKSRRALPW